MQRSRTQQGFGIIEVGIVVFVILILVLTVIAFVSGHKKPAATATATTNQPTASTPAAASTQPPILPDGYTRYTDSQLHFSFGYPSEYGNLQASASGVTGSVQAYLSSEDPDVGADYGRVGAVTLSISKPGIRQTLSSANGPIVTLKADKWIVSQENAADQSDNKVGDEYTAFATDVETPQTQGAGQVYVFAGDDEDCNTHSFVFVSQNHLVKITPPKFCSGSDDGDSSSSSDDSDAYTTQLKTMLGSIWITK